MNNKRRRLLMLCCSNSKKARTVSQSCLSCHQAGQLNGTATCTSCGFTITKHCTSCNSNYCNKCGQKI